MNCPYCNNSKDLDNSNLTHKFSDKSGCKKYFKVCNFCNTIFVNKHQISSSITTNINIGYTIKPVNNILNLNKCPSCNKSWLPDFPMSWLRSITNLDKLYELVHDINKNEDYGVENGDLLNIQKRHYGVKFNKDRADNIGYDKYIQGSLIRRMSEYINQLRIMGIIHLNSKGKYILTDIGHNLVKSIRHDNNAELISYSVLGYINIKINNGYQKNNSNSCYQYFKIRFIENILKSIDFVYREHSKMASKYQIGLSVLCRDESEFKSYCLKNIIEKSPQNIKSFMFAGEKELDRAVVSGFLNIFISLNLIEKKKDLYGLTPFGLSILNFLEEHPAIWYSDLISNNYESYESKNDRFANIILWRLINNNLLTPNDLNIDIEILNKEIAPFMKNKKQIKDIHLNLFYDEPIYNISIINNTYKILTLIKSKLKTDIELDILESKCKELNTVWINELTILVNNNISAEFIKNFSEKSTFKTGEKWENTTKFYFKKLGLDIDFYKVNPVFSNLKISTLNIFLPGGTLYNPDLLIKERINNQSKYILIDSKGASSIINELHKLKGYNLYASHEEVDSYAVIPLNGTLSQTSKKTILKEKDSFNRICIIEKKAIELLITKNLTKSKILEIILPLNGFKHITANDIDNL